MNCQFSPAHYLECLKHAQELGFSIQPVCEYDTFKPSERLLILRHDVDLSLDYALDMALLEHDNDVHSTYYILLRHNLYNALSPEGTEKIRTIAKLDHEIGLHIDTRHYLGVIEFDILGQISKTNIKTWCQHFIIDTPSLPVPPSGDAKDLPIKYTSDSAMFWREGCLCQNLSKYNQIQCLIHPEWRMANPAGKLNKWEVLGKLEWEAKLKLGKSFRQFRDMVYEQPPDLIYNTSK